MPMRQPRIPGSITICFFESCRCSLQVFPALVFFADRRALFAAHTRAEHAHLEQQAAAFNLLLQLGQLCAGYLGWAVRDLNQDALQIVQDVGYCCVAGSARRLAVQAVVVQQIFGHLPLIRDIEFALLIRSVAQLREHHLRPLQVIADGYQQDALAHLLLIGRRLSSFGAMRETSSQKPSQHQHRRRGRPDPPGENAPALARAKLPPDALPDGFAIPGAPLGDWGRIHCVQHQLQGAELGAALLASSQMLLDSARFSGLAVIKERQLFFAQVIHVVVPATGSKLLRSFCTARKILCLVAFVPVPSASPISAIDKPSKCRSTNALRSWALSRSSAALTRSLT